MMLTRTTGAIALRPKGNTQLGYYFMSLTTGKCINRFSWTPLPMPGEVTERVHILARRNPAGTVIQFGWRDGTPLEDEPDEADDAHDEDYLPDSESDSNDDGRAPALPHPAPGVNEYDNGQAPSYNNDNDAKENDAEENKDTDADSNEYSDGKAGDANAENDNDNEDTGSDDNSNPGGGEAYPTYPSETASGNDGGNDPPPTQVATEGVPQVATEGVPQAQVATPAVQGTDTPTVGVTDEMDEKYGARVRIVDYGPENSRETR
jgi:hypothetical protein